VCSVPKRVPDIIDYHLKKDDYILIVFCTNISGTGNIFLVLQMNIHVLISSSLVTISSVADPY